MKKLLRYYLFLLFFIGIYSLQSQTLTISSSGNSGLSSGTNWSLTGNTLTVTGTANIRASVIVNALANGNLTVVGNTTNFAVTVSEAITATGNNTLTVGSATNTGTITFSAVTSFAGPVNIYGGVVNINGTLTSSANGDILLKGISNTSPCVTISSSGGITKSAGTGTLTIQAHGRINNAGSITASGTGIMNIIFWSDFDGDNVGGGVSHNGTISTNGGHVWMGGSNSNGGSYTWNSLAVGDGPSVGAASSNANALDIFGNITTSGGDFLAWAGNGVSSGIYGIGTITGYSVNVGSGDIVLITDAILGTGPSLFFNQSGGSFTLVPNDGSFGTTFNWDGATNTVSGYGTGWNFGGNFNYLWLENPASLTSLTIGKYEGMLSGSTPVVLSNSSDVTFSNTTATSIAGPISIYGGDITVSQNLTSSLADADILLQATGAIILSASRTLQTSGGDVTLNATSGGTATTAQSAIYLNGSSQILSNGGNITLGGGYSGTEGNLYAATTISGIGYAVRMDAATVLNAAGATAGGNINVYGKKVLSYGDGVYLNSVNISTIGNGTIGINGDSFGGYNGTTFFGGVTFETNASTLQTVNGNITLKGVLTQSQSTQGYGINFYRTTGSAGQTRHIQILSQTGDIQITGDRGSSTGGGIGHSSWGNIYFGSPSDNSFTASGDVVLTYSNLVNAGSNGFKVKTTGAVTYEPVASSFIVAQTFPANSNYILADNATSLTIGKTGNTAGVTIGSNISIAGPISVYAGTITLNANLTSTNTTTGNINLNGTTISGTGNMVLADGRTAEVNVSSASTYDGIISGSGSGLTKLGAGMLTLTKDHTYSGATTISGGDLQVGTGGSVSQASSGTINATSDVSIASGSKLILTPNENVVFAAPISGAGGVEIKGASGKYFPSTGTSWLTTSPVQLAANTTVLEALTRITGGKMGGTAITSGPVICVAYQKSYTALNNTATLQLQAFNGDSSNSYTKCVFLKLTQSGSNVIIQVDNSKLSTGAGYKNGSVLGTDISIGGLSITLSTSGGSGYGISEVFMSGKVNFTGLLSYSGNTVLSNTVSSSTATYTGYNYTSKGTQEITDASSSFPSSSTVVNNGLVILNRTTPLTIASNMEGTEEVLQVGADITLTGTNTHTGITTIDLNKKLNIGSGSTTGSITGNVVNYGTLTFDRSDASTHTGVISGSGSLVKSGAGAHTLTGLNTYTGATTINAGKLVLERDVPITSSSSYSGAGTLVIQPSSSSFTSAVSYPIAGFTVSNAIGGLTIGKLTNTANITFGNTTTIAGPITVYGGTIALEANLTTTNNGDISLYTDAAIGGLTAARTITAAGSFNYIPRSDFFSAPVTYPITNLNLTSSGLLIGKSTNTAAITFANATTVAGPITAYGGTITLNADLTTTNNGDISLYTDNPLGGLSTPRTLTAAGAFKYIPRGTTFSADVTYPIANLTATSTGLTIGNATNDKNITIDADVTGGAGIELYGNNVNINSNLTTTGTSAIMHLKGNTTIAAGKTITSGGNFTHDGNLLFKSDATSTAAFGTLGGTFTTVSGLATTERYVPSKRGWRLLTAPLKGATNNTIPANWQGVNDEGLLFFSPSTYQSQAMTGYTIGGGMPNIWKYDSVTTQWQSIPNLTTENLFTSTGNNGFLVFATGPSNSTNIASGATETTLRPEGQLITGNVTHSLTADKYHLIGNPYASPLHTEAMVQANANTKVFMVDPTIGTVGGYVTYDGSNWAPEPAINDKYIQSGQGFFVRSASNPTFTISESHKVVGNSNTWFDRASSSANTTSSSSVEADKIRVLLYKQVDSQWQLADGILTVNSATGNNDVDATDTEKMSNFNENIGFRNGTSTLAIEYRGLPTIGTIQPMRLTGTTVQPYQLRVKTENYSNSDLQPYVEDTQTGVLTLIPIDGSEVVVHFTGIAATTTAPDSRFRIVYPATLSSDDPTTSLSVGIYPNPVEDKMFTIVLANQDETTQYTLTNLLGQQVQQGKLDTLQNTVSVASLQGGVYVLQVVQSGKTFTTKLIIK